MNKIKRALTVTVAAIVMASGIGWLVLRTSLPQTDGSLRLPGLHGLVGIVRDDNGIPTISATSEADGYFALGFVHAQDRLWQMESMRRLGSGRLSEILGAATLSSDRFMRTLGLYRLAEQSVSRVDAPTRAVLEAYAAGVNAWIERHTGLLPPEFLLLGLRPEPWRPADSLVWGRLMAMTLGSNWRDELLRVRMAEHLPPERVRQLWAHYPDDAPTTVTALPVIPSKIVAALLSSLPEALQPTEASNAWALSGERSETGLPLLANDPHLRFSAPVLWYLARIELPGVILAGVTVPGVPFHVLGHNGTVAWGMTMTESDAQDLFVERLNGKDRYDTQSGPQPVTTRTESIAVRGLDTEHLTVRTTRHGPVISDAVPEAVAGEGTMLALAAVGLDEGDLTPQALYHMARAKTWAEFEASARDFHAPQANLMYADRAGTIAMVSSGHVPVRATGDGTVPVPGWTGSHDWTGWIPFDRLPKIVSPAVGVIINANNKVMPVGYPYLLTAHWPAPYRAERITHRLAATPRLSAGGMAALQLDDVSEMANDIKPLLLDVKTTSELEKTVVALLKAWDGTMGRDRPEPLIFTTWVNNLVRIIFAEKLGDAFGLWSGEHPQELKMALVANPEWCGDLIVPDPERCRDRIAEAFRETLTTLVARYGADPAAWRWGDAHVATFRHALFHQLPILGYLSDLSIPSNGGDFTINRGTFSVAAPGERAAFPHIHGAGFRAVYDFSNLDDSIFIIATGQSGNPLSSHYSDLMTRWRDGGRVKLGGGGRHRLVLAESIGRLKN